MCNIREEYVKYGVLDFYKKKGKVYHNPHEEIIHRLLKLGQDKWELGNKILDLCCGSGEVTLALRDKEVIGVDPYTVEAYKARTGKETIALDFKDIVEGKLSGEYDTIICSFAMHLCKKSMLPNLLWQLGQISKQLIILTPHKRPDCDNISNWILVDEYKYSKVSMRMYIQ